MYNNDILIRIRYAFDIKNTDMVEIFRLGGMNLSKEEVLKMLTKALDGQFEDIDSVADIQKNAEHLKCDNKTFESFLNGWITFKRGKQTVQSDSLEKPMYLGKVTGAMNNIFLKKMKIALALTSEEMLSLFNKGGVQVSKNELSAFLRKEGERHYKECLDMYIRNFLRGLTMEYRK